MSFASGRGRKQEASGPAPRAEFIPRELRQVAAPLQRRQVRRTGAGGLAAAWGAASGHLGWAGRRGRGEARRGAFLTERGCRAPRWFVPGSVSMAVQEGGGTGAGEAARGGRRRGLFTWEEIGLRTKRGDPRREMWLVVDRQVYDVRHFYWRHPGGARILKAHIGEDATDAFHTMHADSTLVKSFLSSLQIGELASDEPSSEPSKNKQLIDDFRELRATITKMGLMKPNIFFYLCLLLHIILLEAAAWLTLLYCGTSLLPFTASLIFLTTSQIQASWLQHDLGHFSVFPKTKWNRRFQKFVMNHLIGGSSKWWNLLHNQHHVKPNCYSKDPDVSFHPFLFAFGKNLSVELGIKMTKYMPYNHQHKYFSIILPPLLIPALFHYHNFFVIFKKKFWMDLACMVSFFFRFFFISWNLLGVNCLIFYLLLRMLVSCWFVWVSQMSHIPMDIDYDKNLDWFSTQLKATCNVEQSLFNDWFTGHLNFQIEHHLFPSMPRHNFWKAAPLVKSLCAKHSIEYQCKPLLKAFADILHSLKEYGDLWLDAYLHK
ncbi:acyl-CoA (8-3)-desaturase-like [Paroedura picta]|uniref:acyl-CoA (8-3)-desaturase-like n=1 Tax=Paroedura picta TaxID=143630 RepID=UPI0040578EE6